MIAKWYQKARRPSPVALEKISDMPIASVGAPPVRAIRDSSSTAAAADCSSPGEIAKPRPLTACEADCTVSPTTPAGAFIA